MIFPLGNSNKSRLLCVLPSCIVLGLGFFLAFGQNGNIPSLHRLRMIYAFAHDLRARH